MSNYSALKTDINNNIYENNTQQITGTVLNTVLKDMVNTLGAGYQFAGCAYLDLNPGAPDAKVFYLAGEGLYTNFDNIQVPAGKLGILKWDTRWHLETIEGLGGGGANLTGYISVASTDDLPDVGQPTIGYLCGTNLYLYVGEGGDTKDGKYQNCGGFRGPEGVGITEIEQVEQSTANGGRNTIRIHLSNGSSYDVYTRNGTTSTGLFPTLAALQSAYPSPVVGQYAFVGAGFPADIYVCNTAGTWTDSGADYDGDSVDLTDYATKAELNQLEAKVTDLELPSGSYTQAQARVYDHPEEWCFLLNQPGAGIRKPIWHIGNGVFIDATGAVISFDVVTPASPTFSPDGGAVSEGTVVTLACATPNADIYVSTDNGETYTKTSTVTISEAVTLMAYSELEGIRSAVVSKAFTIAVDHRFKFTVKLDQDNATVYVPVAAGTYYTMEVDWGDGSTPDTYNHQLIGLKNCGHTYSGLAGDTFQITIRGTEIPKLYFFQATAFTLEQLYSIDDNTLDVVTDLGSNGVLQFGSCDNLVSICDNAFSNASPKTAIKFTGCKSLLSLGPGILSIFSNGEIAAVNSMFSGCTALSLSNEFMSTLAAKMGTAITSVASMFASCKGSIQIPNGFFDNLASGTLTNVKNMTGQQATGVTGDAKALYDVLVTKATAGITDTSGCFSGSNLSNRNQVPTAWGGTM